jgi:hypothetical protein
MDRGSSVDVCDIVARLSRRLIKVEAALMVPGWSYRGWVGIETLMPDISLDGVAVLDGRKSQHIAATAFAFGHVNLEHLRQHFAPRVVFELSRPFFVPELRSLFDLGSERDLGTEWRIRSQHSTPAYEMRLFEVVSGP